MSRTLILVALVFALLLGVGLLLLRGRDTPEPVDTSATAVEPVIDLAAAFGVAPKPTHRQDPKYPESARAAAVGGKVMVRLSISPTGEVVVTEVVKVETHPENESVQDDFVEAALAAAENWTFEPATKDGEPVASQVVLPIQFRLN